MKRFMMLIAVAVVAGVMYVAASPASQQARGVTLKQFNALKKQVATLSKKLNSTRAEADFAVAAIATCYLKDNGNNTFSFSVLQVSQRGTTAVSGPGYLYGTSGVNAPTTALDVVASSPQAYLQKVDPSCASLILSQPRAGALAKNSLERWAGHR